MRRWGAGRGEIAMEGKGRRDQDEAGGEEEHDAGGEEFERPKKTNRRSGKVYLQWSSLLSLLA